MKTGGKAHKRGQVVGTLVATIGSFSLGTVLAWPAPALPQLAKEHGISQNEAGLSVEEMSWVGVALRYLGASSDLETESEDVRSLRAVVENDIGIRERQGPTDWL